MSDPAQNSRRDFVAAFIAAVTASALPSPATAASPNQQSESVSGEEESTKVYILNALWFAPEGGSEKYAEYGAAVGPLVARYGGRIDVRAYVPQQALIGEFDADLVFFVQWPSLQVFQQFLKDPDLPAVSTIRSAAITKSLLIQCTEAPK